ncbi:MAG: Cna B-type domain-containing protein, partial [Lachnospiraceae bacterium]|nr:Cna B-type domain-containing protein [Lachnospiraceae bacterium]
GPVTIHFSSQCSTESGCDYLYIYYMQNGQIYRVTQQLMGTNFPDIRVPSRDMYFVWYTDGSVVRWGYEVESIEPYDGTDFSPAVKASLPGNYTMTEADGLPHTAHNYSNGMRQIQHYGLAPFDITNIYDMTSVTVTKEWSGDTEAVRPESITVSLLQNGEVFRTQEITAEDGWTYTFGQLPLLDEEGDAYTYTVREDDVPAHYRVTYSNGTATANEPAAGYDRIINTFTQIVISGQKRWAGDDESVRPEQITVHLLQNGTEIASTTTDAAHNWAYSFTADRCDAEGNDYEYTVREDVPAEYHPLYPAENGAVTVRFNSRCQTENSYDYLYIYYRLNGVMYRVNTRYTGSNFPTSLNLPSSDLYFVFYSDSSVTKYGYRVESIEPYAGTSFAPASQMSLPSGYTQIEVSGLPETAHNYTNGMRQIQHWGVGPYDVTNIYDYTTVTVQKTWSGDVPEARPESVTLTLLQNGEDYRTVQVTAQDGWQYTFTGLPIADADGNAYRYSVREEDISESYTVTYSNGSAQSADPSDGYYIVNNRYNYTTYTVWKYWYNDTEADRPGSIELVLTQNGQDYRRHTLTAQEQWTYTFTELPVQAADGSYYSYSVYEAEVPDGYQVNYSTYSGGASIYNYCTLQTVIGQKYWIGDDPADRPETITVTLYRDGEEYASTTASAAQDWQYTFRVPMVDPETGRQYVYTVSEAPVDGYETRYLSPSPILITFADDCDGADRPEGASWGGDSVYLFFRYGGQFYQFGTYTVDELAGLQILCPSGDLFFGYYTEPDVTDRYGWSIADIRTVDQSEIGPDGYSYPPISQIQLDIRQAVEYTGSGFFTTPHPDTQTEPTLWHYEFLDLDSATSKPEPYGLGIVNIREEEPPEETTPEETTPEETAPEETTPPETQPAETETPSESESTVPETTAPAQQPPKPPAGPGTGDPTALISWVTVFGASGAAVITAALRRKKKDDETDGSER